MKVCISLWILLSISLSSFAQQGINYKAIIKDTNGNVLATEFMNVQFTIHETSPTGTIVYQEDYNYTTDSNGMIILNIGSDPTPSVGVFEDINWSADIHFLQMTITYSEGTIDFDATQFMAVPYALSSMDNLWQRNENNAIAVTEKVGVGTDTPSQLLSLNNPDNASIQLETATFSDTTGIRFENGQKTGEHTFFKIENTSDNLRISVDSDFTPATDYEEVLAISTSGSLFIEGNINANGSINAGTSFLAPNGTSINEFSTDGNLTGSSNNAIPTEAAVKTYVDNSTTFSTTSNVTSNAPGSISTDDFVFGDTQLNYSGSQTRKIFFDKSKGAIRAGFVNGTQWNTQNIGDFSTAFGFITEATGDRSTALGSGTIASRFASTAIGNYNADDGNALFMIGNGTSNGNRNNAFTVKDNGDTVLDGELNTSSTGTINMIPVAYGNINGDEGTIAGGTNNLNVSLAFVNNEYVYTISVSGKTLTFQNTSFFVTPIFGSSVIPNFVNGNIEIYFGTGSTPVSRNFSIIIYNF